MAKYTIETEEIEELKDFMHALQYKCVISEIDNYLRGRLKHEELDEPVFDALDQVRAYLHEYISDCGISID